MASPPAPDPSTDPPILFRPSKKRKLYRQRDVSPGGVQASPDPDAATTATSPPPAQSLDELIAHGADAAASEQGDETTPSLAEILRLRKQRRARTATTTGGEGRHGHAEEEEEEGQHGHTYGLVERGEEERGVGVVRTFAPQTGVVGRDEVDRHM
jgi:hypothetical protein